MLSLTSEVKCSPQRVGRQETELSAVLEMNSEETRVFVEWKTFSKRDHWMLKGPFDALFTPLVLFNSFHYLLFLVPHQRKHMPSV